MNTNSPPQPVILAFVSGKGGVGKTMLAVASARELSSAGSTLIVDLDFFNRGLSGLLTGGTKEIAIRAPNFIKSQQDKNWKVREVAPNLYTVSFPDVLETHARSLQAVPIDVTGKQLKRWLEELCSQVKCQTVILDCHGGPDALSFAAAKVADEVLLVSEPDRITMYGTLHFIRRLNEQCIDTSNVHLIFNKVVESFTSLFLRSLYNRTLRHYFSGKPLLGIFPLEVYLTKHFERYPFVTEDYPESMLAHKTEVMIADLLTNDRDEVVSQKARSIPQLVAWKWRWSLGKTPKVLQLYFVMKLSLIVLLTVLAAAVLEKYVWPAGFPENMFEVWFLPVVVGVPMWAAFVTLLSWSNQFDREVTLCSRRARWVPFFGYAAVMAVVWVLPMGLMHAWLVNVRTIEEELMVLRYLGYAALLVVFLTWMSHLFRVYRDFRFTSHRIEPWLRCILGVIVVSLGVGFFVERASIVEMWLDTSAPTLFNEMKVEDLPNSADIIVLDEDEFVRNDSTGEIDWYRIFVKEEGEYDIFVESEDGDPTAGLFKSDKFELLTEDDDGGHGINSKIRRGLESGQYYVAVRELLERPYMYTVRYSKVRVAEEEAASGK